MCGCCAPPCSDTAAASRLPRRPSPQLTPTRWSPIVPSEEERERLLAETAKDRSSTCSLALATASRAGELWEAQLG